MPADAQDFATAVFARVGEVPPGFVTTYGDIARSIGRPRSARRVGWVIARAPDTIDLPFHRVVDRAGFLSGGWAFGHPDIMKSQLLAEGVPFRDDYRVDIDACRFAYESISAADEMDDF